MQQSVRDNATLIERAFAPALGSPTASRCRRDRPTNGSFSWTSERRASSRRRSSSPAATSRRRSSRAAGARPRSPHILRTDPRGRRCGEGGDLQDDARHGQARTGHPDHLVGSARDHRRQRRDPRHAGRNAGRRTAGRRPEEEVMRSPWRMITNRTRWLHERSVAIAPAPAWRRHSAAPPLLLVGSILLYVGVALWTGQTRMLATDGVIGLLQRMVGLGSSRSGRLSPSSPGRSTFRSPT